MKTAERDMGRATLVDITNGLAGPSLVRKVRNAQTAKAPAVEAAESEAADKEKRYEVVVERFRRKLGNKCVFMTLAAWQSFVARIKWERMTLERFTKKMGQRRELSSFMGWVLKLHRPRHVDAVASGTAEVGC